MKRFFQILFLFAFASVIAPLSVRSSNAPYLGWYARDAYGNSLVGATLNFYDHTTLLPRNVYSDEALSISLGAVLTSDGAGHFARFYMDPNNYKIIFKTAAGATVWTEDNVYGLKTNLLGIVSATSGSGTAAITGTNTSSGYAVHAITTAGSSHALYVAADTSAPVKSAVHIVPQDNTPSAPTKGDLWFDTATGQIRFYNGAAAALVVSSGDIIPPPPAAANHNGGIATGNGTGAGFNGEGGDASGPGFLGGGGAPNGVGGDFTGAGTGSGVVAYGGGTNGRGGFFYGDGSGAGSQHQGGDNSGYGIVSTGGAANGPGGSFTGVGTGSALECNASGSGYGVVIQADTTSPVRAALRLVPQDTNPTSPQEGDIYYNSALHHFYGYTNIGWVALDL